MLKRPFSIFMIMSTMGIAQVPESVPIGPANVPLKQVSPGIFALGKVELDKALRTVTFPAILNMEDSIVEYLLVTDQGKIHESLLRTDVEPYHIQLAMLFLGAKGSARNTVPETQPAEISGEKLAIEVSWEGPAGRRIVPAEELIWNRQELRPMSRGPWVYNGSRVLDGVFLAQQDGSVISLIVDPAAIVNNPRPGAQDDELWLVNTNGLPPLNSPVKVTLRLQDRAKPKTDE